MSKVNHYQNMLCDREMAPQDNSLRSRSAGRVFYEPGTVSKTLTSS